MVGNVWGVTPMWAHFTLELYAHHRAQGCYYSPIVQDMYNWLQAHQCPLLPTTGGMPTASSFAPAVGLAARLSYPLGTTIQPPTAAVSSATATTSTGSPVVGTRSPLVLRVASPPAQPASAHTPMEVDGTTVVAHPDDVGVDTSDIYCDRMDDSPSAKSSCPTLVGPAPGLSPMGEGVSRMIFYSCYLWIAVLLLFCFLHSFISIYFLM